MDAHAARPDELARTARAVQRLARELVRDGARADDLAQDAWVAALRAGGRIRGPLGPWLAGALRRLRRSDGRGAARRDARERRAARPEAQAPVDELLARAELGERLLSAVRELPEAYRETLLLRYLEELEPEEIARRHGISASTVRTRAQRGLALLRARLGEREGGLAAVVPLLRGLAAPKAAPVIVMTKAAKVGAGVAALALAVFVLRAPLAPEAEAASQPVLEHFAIEGVVLDAAGATIADATVTTESELGERRTDIAGDYGEYGFRELGPGRWTLRASAPDRLPFERPLLLRGEARVERIELVLESKPRLAVHVLASGGASYSAVLGHSAHSLAAIASAEPPPALLQSGSAALTSVGRWRRDSGPDGRLGELRVEARADYFVSLVLGEWVLATRPVRLGAESVSFVLDAQAVEDPLASVTMRFVDATGAPLAGVLPGLGTRGRRGFAGPTGADGRASFAGLTPGTYELRLHESALQREFRLTAGQALDLGDLEPGGGAHLRVHVVTPDAGAGSGSVSWGRERVDGSRTARVTDGVAELRGLEPGRYVVGVHKKGRPAGQRARLAWADVTEEATAEVTLRLDPVGQLLLQPDGAASIGTRYRLRDEGTGLVNRSGEVRQPQPLRLQLPKGPWLMELETQAGERSDVPVFVGPEPVTVTLSP